MDPLAPLDRRRLLAMAALAVVPPSSLLGPAPEGDPTVSSLPTAHAHNDYRQPDPCDGALDLGFTSIEIDVLPRDGELLVGHGEKELRPGRDLRSLYLDPVLRRCKAAESTSTGPLPDGHRLTLLIDIKRAGMESLALLEPLLEPLRSWLRRVEDRKIVDGPIEIVLSGARPTDTVRSRSDRLVFIDGRPSDLGRDVPVELMPLVSASLPSAVGSFGYRGLDEPARERLATLARRTHDEGRRLRFWGHMESAELWKALVENEVDLIGTDQPKRLAAWLRKNDPRCGA